MQVPTDTPATATVYIAGSFQGWDPGSPAHALAKLPDGRWSITLDLPDGTPIAYKFTRGDWGTVEKGPGGEEIADRTHTPNGTQTVDHTVARWADGNASTITGNVTTFTLTPFLNARRVWVYLPPGYDDTDDRYPVLYMHDGQNLFDSATSFSGEWEVDETCEALIGAGEIEPIIVVGIDNGQNFRISEYTPWPDPQYGGGNGDNYLAALRDVLIPEIDSRYRTRADAAHRYMSGSSLGGLISAYAAYTHPDTWSRVACLSSSYWWDDTHMLTYATGAGRSGGFVRFYQDHGTNESGGLDHLATMRSIALSQGFIEGLDFLSVIGAGHQHNEAAWAERMPDALRFLVDAPCFPDCNDDDALNIDDIDCYVTAFLAGDLAAADCDANGALNVDDIDCFVAAFLGGCP
ncbi:MAG: phosphonate ABC transporter ATP-binding protein [Phycisphaeraceae bacterium]|nr:MAG: phosphonate ABC transporter ATP-binding protein [Phycisphaeraceae bacterium]